MYLYSIDHHDSLPLPTVYHYCLEFREILPDNKAISTNQRKIPFRELLICEHSLLQGFFEDRILAILDINIHNNGEGAIKV